MCDIQGRLFENAGKAGYNSAQFIVDAMFSFVRYGMVVDEGKQQQICAEHTNSKCVEPDSVVIADKSARIDLTDSLTGVIKNSCDIDAEKEKSLKEKYGFGN